MFHTAPYRTIPYQLFVAVNGADGSVLWNVKTGGTSFELYSVFIIKDVNRDNYSDIIAGRYAKNKGTRARGKRD